MVAASLPPAGAESWVLPAPQSGAEQLGRKYGPRTDSRGDGGAPRNSRACWRIESVTPEIWDGRNTCIFVHVCTCVRVSISVGVYLSVCMFCVCVYVSLCVCV